MKLIALLIGLAIERLATHLFHLRELRWLDRIIDAGFRQTAQLGSWPPLLLVLLLTVVIVLPVFLVRLTIGNAMFDFPFLVFAVIVLFFSLGPRDIAEEVDEYCTAISSGDHEAVRVATKALLEQDPPDDTQQRTRMVEEAVCVQGNKRLFAVIFWFVLLGPTAAWAYRVTDLVRRRAVFRSARDDTGSGAAAQVVGAAETLHGWLAWIPARLTAISYAMAGSFDGAVSAWRGAADPSVPSGRTSSEALLARVGVGAIHGSDDPDEPTGSDECGRALAARRLVMRSLIIWTAVIAAMTLYGWAV